MYTLSGIHMLETVAKPMLQMLETQQESSTKRIQSLQTKLEKLSLGINDEYYCDGKYGDNENQENVPENSVLSNEVFSTLVSIHEKTKEKKSSMVSSPV